MDSNDKDQIYPKEICDNDLIESNSSITKLNKTETENQIQSTKKKLK